MSELYRAEDGTIRRRGTPEEPNVHERPLPQTEHGGRKFFFVMYCIFITIALGGAIYTNLADIGSADGFFGGIQPIATIICAGLSCLIYGCGSADERGYDLGAFFFVTLAAAAGAAIAFFALELLPMIFSSFIYFIIAVVALGVIGGALGG